MIRCNMNHLLISCERKTSDTLLINSFINSYQDIIMLKNPNLQSHCNQSLLVLQMFDIKYTQ